MRKKSTYRYHSEEQLIEDIQAKSSEAFEYLYDHYSSAIYGIIHKIVRHEEIAEEVLQDVFLKIWEKSLQYDSHKGRLFTWMLNMARNMAIDKTRSKEFSNARKTDQGIEHVDMVSENKAEQIPTEMGVQNALDLLPTDQKKLIVMMYFEGYSQSDISENLEMPLGTVKTRVRSAMTKLREILK